MQKNAAGNFGQHAVSFKNNELKTVSSNPVNTPIQGRLFHVERQVEFDEVEMGVLESGVPYITNRGLAKMCGIDHAALHRLTTNWNEEKYKPRGRAIQQILDQAGYNEPSLYLKAEHNGVAINAFTEPVCLALLEYYAFVADEKRDKAVATFRTLARVKFREFVYQAVGYSPEQNMLESWKHFHDRIDLTTSAVPIGYFCVYEQIAGMIVSLIRNGVSVNDKVLPDISAGRAWSAHWVDNNLEERHGERIKFDHEYPDYYPQSKSNPQPAHAYPNSALGDFQNWFRGTYLAGEPFPKYLSGQVKKGTIQLGVADQLVHMFSAKQLENKQKKPANLPHFKKPA